MALTFAMSQVYDYSFLLLFGAPRVCLWIEIRRYKITVKMISFSITNNKSKSSVYLYDVNLYGSAH